MNKKYLKIVIIIVLVILSAGITASFAQKINSGKLAKNPENDYRYLIEINGKYGFINKIGEEIIKPQYDYAEEFSEGLAPVCNNIDKEGQQKCGYIDIYGKNIIPLGFEQANSFSDELGLVQLKNKYGFVNKKGKLVINAYFDEAQSFSEGLAAVKVNNKWGFIDKDGNIKIKPQFDTVRLFSNGLAWFGKTQQDTIIRHGYINKKGRKVIVFKEFFLSQDFNSNLAPKQIEENCTYINKNGKEVLNLQKLGLNTFREIEGGCAPFSNNLLVVEYGTNYEKFGYIDTSGKLIIKLDIKNNTGSEIFPSYKITSQKLIKIAYLNPNGDIKFGFVNKKGKVIVQPICSCASEFKNGLGKV